MITRADLQAMLDVEAALAEAEASLNIIPEDAARAVRAAARSDFYDLAALDAASVRAGNPAIPLVRELTARIAATDAHASRYVHWGATSQDVIDTAIVLQLRKAVPVVTADLERAAEAAATHARRHAATIMAGRTWLQQATPITFGLKAAGWVDALDRTADSLKRALNEALMLQFGGASGTLAALGEHGPAVAAAVAARLGLSVPAIPWHAHRDRLAALACAMGVTTGTAGKIARDLALLAQTEIAEAHEPPGCSGGSSTMPQKQNPVRAAIAIAAAVRIPGLVATMLSAMPQEHERGIGGWQAEWDTLPQIVALAGDAARALAGALEDLVVEPERMRHNLDATGGLAMAEAIAMRLAPVLGKQEAHDRIERAARVAAAESRAFVEVLTADPIVSGALDPSQLTRALSPERHLGSAAAFVTAVLDRHRKGQAIK